MTADGIGAPDRPLIDQLAAYHARLHKAGRLLEARAVERCILLAKRAEKQLLKVSKTAFAPPLKTERERAKNS
jgi:hypothetical protein